MGLPHYKMKQVGDTFCKSLHTKACWTTNYLYGICVLRESHQLQLFMKDGKWNSSFVDISKTGFNKDSFFIG